MLLMVFILTPAIAFDDSHIEPFVSDKGDAMVQMNQEAARYQINPASLKRVAKCESGYNKDAINTNDPNGGSKGILQFQDLTFYQNAAILKIENPDIWNVSQQIQTAAYLFSKGEAHQWTCK